MTEPVTYSLLGADGNSEGYYRRVRSFTEEVLEHAQSTVMPTVNRFMEYVHTYTQIFDKHGC